MVDHKTRKLAKKQKPIKIKPIRIKQSTSPVNTSHDYFELNYTSTDKGKAIVKDLSLIGQFAYPSYSPVLDQRWRALITKTNTFSAGESPEPGPGIKKITLNELYRLILKICGNREMVGEQREIYYTIRGLYPELLVNDKEWTSLYDEFIGPYTKRIELVSKLPIQCFGVEAGHRGMLAGEGDLYLEDGTRVPLAAKPTLRFELARAGVTYKGNARKNIYYEKEAGFASLVSGDIAQMIEAVFSTSQGYLADAAEKFLRDSEERGMKVYCLHDGDVHGIQMQMMYGLASKNSCYMPSRFYPQNVTYLGLVPRVANALSLPPEKVSDNDRAIIPNLRNLLQERGEFLEDVDIIDSGKKWEYQSLNALNERACQVYLVESLRARGDEIKYVPPASQLKEAIRTTITDDVGNFTERQISQYADDLYFNNIKPELVKQLKNKLESDVAEFETMMKAELPKLDSVPDKDIREAVKVKLVENPKSFWHSGQEKVAREMIKQDFNIVSHVDWAVNVLESSAEKNLTITEPKTPDRLLTKNDIADAIQKRILPRQDARNKTVKPIRLALEEVFGKPDLEW